MTNLIYSGRNFLIVILFGALMHPMLVHSSQPDEDVMAGKKAIAEKMYKHGLDYRDFKVPGLNDPGFSTCSDCAECFRHTNKGGVR